MIAECESSFIFCNYKNNIFKRYGDIFPIRVVHIEQLHGIGLTNILC